LASPHSLVQELLNHSDDHLWAMVSNGRRLRILRDNTSLTRPAFVEFDLEAIFTGQYFSDFALLWLVCHESRFEGGPPERCWLERWRSEAKAQGVRALDALRDGFEKAITALGNGFLRHRANTALRDRLTDGQLSIEEFHREILRLVYRLVFLLVIEDRDLLHPPNTSNEVKQLYRDSYSVSRVREHARRHRGGRYGDLWESLKPVFRSLYRTGLHALGLPALGSFLWSDEACADLNSAQLSNADLLAASRALAFIEREHALNRVDFSNLGPEELGSVYESLLELVPRIDAGVFSLLAASGNERQSTGSYYTPTGLVSELLDLSLNPVIERAARNPDAVAALLSIKVIDPACGSGHFLIAAAQRIATRVAVLTSGESSPSPEEIRHALRRVVSGCVYGIDVNPMAVELAKVSLWLETVEPGRPLSFLDQRIACGDALFGTTPALIEAGIPDEAYVELPDDDRKAVTSARTRNRRERDDIEIQLDLDYGIAMSSMAISEEVAAINAIPDDTPENVAEKERRWAAVLASSEAERARLAADAWCAAFTMPKLLGHDSTTTEIVRRLGSNPRLVPVEVTEQIRDEATRYRFLHPHLAFPDVFEPNGGDYGWSGGFDCVIGNPPWGRVEMMEERFFAARAPEIATAPNQAARKTYIALLEQDNPSLWEEFRSEQRRIEALSNFFHYSGRFPFTGVGKVNTYALFAELACQLLGPDGRSGLIVQSGIATGDTTKAFFADLVDRRRLVAIHGFENEELLFPAVHHATRFCLLSMASPGSGPEEIELSFFNRQPNQIHDAAHTFSLTARDFQLINPNTRTCPVFRSSTDARIAREAHRHFNVLIRDDIESGNPWGVTMQVLFNMASDSGEFRTRQQLLDDGWHFDGVVGRKGDCEYLPLLEGKMVDLWNPRARTYAGQTTAQANQGVVPPADVNDLRNPRFEARPKYWVRAEQVSERWNGSCRWAICWRKMIAKERSLVPVVTPQWGIGDSMIVAHLSDSLSSLATCYLSCWSSLLTDYLVRQRADTGNMSMFVIKQLPTPPPEIYLDPAPWAQGQSLRDWITPRGLELLYTCWSLAPFAEDEGGAGWPFRWDAERRAVIKAELDAAFFHIFGLTPEDVEHVLDSFGLVSDRDLTEFGEYRTKRIILDIFDRMQNARDSGGNFESSLDPGPGSDEMRHQDR
jgi:predicted RNA methylase